MPYIHPNHRQLIDEPLEDLIDKIVEGFGKGCPGVLNYVISRIVTEVIAEPGKPWRYDEIAEAVAAFECAKMEFYRRIAGPKEDVAIAANGDIPAYGGV